ncbi:MAG: DUF5591 domain-containing protein [Methanosarcinaceae archaeon]|nr:DUF5591 domain-containing protein [Methanosarcinaceae archaeon]
MKPIIPLHERSDEPLDTENIINHPDMVRANEWFVTEYIPPVRDICIFVPCSKKKPYHTSPSHKMFDSIIFSCLKPEDVHIVTFGTCGVTPREFDEQYPFADYSFMMGKCNVSKIKSDFLRVETKRLVSYLKYTENNYKKRIAYCIGDFREAMIRASEKSGIFVKIVPLDETVECNLQPNKKFIYNSLSCEPYKKDFKNAILKIKNELKSEDTDESETDELKNNTCNSNNKKNEKSDKKSSKKSNKKSDIDIEWFEV